jgi:hypothetical protein
LLQELQENAEREAVEEPVLAIGEDVAEFSCAATRLFKSQFDAAKLGANFGVMCINSFECSQAGAGLL